MIDDCRRRRKFRWQTSVLAAQGTLEQKIQAAIAASRASGCTCKLDVRLTTSTRYTVMWIDVKHQDQCRIRRSDAEVTRWFAEVSDRINRLPRVEMIDYEQAVAELQAAQQCLECVARHLGVRLRTASATKEGRT